MKIIEFHRRLTKNFENTRIPIDNYENQENLRTTYEYYENQNKYIFITE